MIQLASGQFIVLRKNGRQSAFSLQELHKDLLDCFRSCGIKDQWTVENINLIIEEQLLLETRKKTLSEAHIEHMIAAVLSAAGFTDVAAEYNRRKNVNPAELLCINQQPWDRQRIFNVLQNSLPLQEAENSLLTEKVTAALQQLGFSQINDALILQMGRHCLQQRQENMMVPNSSVSWLFLPQYWNDRLNAAMREAVQAQIISIQPVPRVLPKARLRLDLGRVAAERQTQPLLEMDFLPALRIYCRMLPELFLLIEREIPASLRHDKQSAHLMVVGLKKLLADGLLLHSHRRLREFRQFVRAVIEHDVAAQLSNDLLITIK